VLVPLHSGRRRRQRSFAIDVIVPDGLFLPCGDHLFSLFGIWSIASLPRWCVHPFNALAEPTIRPSLFVPGIEMIFEFT